MTNSKGRGRGVVYDDTTNDRVHIRDDDITDGRVYTRDDDTTEDGTGDGHAQSASITIQFGADCSEKPPLEERSG